MNPIPYCSGANACVYTTRPRPTYKLARMKKHQTSRRDVSSRLMNPRFLIRRDANAVGRFRVST